MLKNAEINGANQYFTMYFLAKELGYDEIADEVRHSNEEGAHKIAELIEHSIPEELDHAKRLEEAMSACGIEF